MRQTYTLLTACLISLLLLAVPAQAQWTSPDASVTIYSLDNPAQATPYPSQQHQQHDQPYQYQKPQTVQATAQKTKAAATTPTDQWLGAKWSGRANLGASLQTGNTEQDAINADASVKAIWPEVFGKKHRASIKAEFNRETENDTRTEDNKSVDIAYDYFFADQWFFNSTLGLEQDDIDQIDLRTTAGMGIGHQPYESDDLNLQYVFGPTYLREEFENGSTDSSAAARWALDYDQRIWDNVLQIFHEHELLVPGDDTDGYIFDSKTGLRIPLKKGLVATGQIDFEWDNNPAIGVVEDNTTYAAKLGYEW